MTHIEKIYPLTAEEKQAIEELKEEEKALFDRYDEARVKVHNALLVLQNRHFGKTHPLSEPKYIDGYLVVGWL